MAASNDRFNLINLLNQRSKENASQEAKTAEKSVAMSAESAMADIYDLIPSKDNFYSTEDIQDLKQSIELLGILQPLLVTDEGGGKFQIIAGHRRRLAAMQLAEEGREHFRRVPVMIRPSKNAILDRLALIMTNRFREKTEWEKMTETIETKNLVRELKEQMDIPGRTRELLSEIIGTSFAQIGRYEAIYNNLEADLMTEFKSGKIGMTVAYEASGLKKEWQLHLMEMLRNNNALTLADVKEARRQQETQEAIQEAENAENGRNSGEREEAAAEDAGEKQEDNSEASAHDKEGGTGQEGYIDPTPESVISICYSCTQYETCHDKKATVTSCNAYSNRQEAYKTDDQRYDEEQTKIDAETKKKLRER